MFFQINNVTYHIGTEGPLTRVQPPLVLLHGFTGSTENWQPLTDRLALQGRSVIAIDILGHGRSGAPLDPTRYAMEFVARDIVNILSEQLGLTEVDLLGYSMGGRLALAIAHSAPHLVQTLLLESASPGLKTAAERASRKASDDALADWIEQHGIPAFVDRWAQVPLFDSQERLPDETRVRLRNQRLRNRVHGLANSLRGMGTGVQPSFWPHLGEMTMPVHLIVGELDTKFCRIGEAMVEKLSNPTLTVVENAGHTVHLEQPKRFTDLCVELLR